MVFVRAESANKSYSMNLDLLQAALMHMCREQIILIQRKEKVNQSEHSRVFGMFKGLNGIWVIL